MIPPPGRRVLGAVLAGGASSRFGSDKALAMLDGVTLLERAYATLAPWADTVVVVGRPRGVPDRSMPGLGPLGGIAGALAHAAQLGFDSVLTIGCDMPAVPAELVEALRREAPAYCRDAPVLGHWPVVALAGLDRRLALTDPSIPARGGDIAGDRFAHAQQAMPEHSRPVAKKDAALSVRRWAASIGAVAIPAPAPLRNVNTPVDLAS